jgi:tRNA(Ile)-lysidine synthase
VNRRQFQIRARFRRAIREAAIGDGSILLVAVSGGCDSAYLLHLVLGEQRQRRWTVWVGHVDHSLRSGSGDDARFVRELARECRVPSIGARIDPGVWATDGSIEERARIYRHRALRRMARKVGAGSILLGHTRDDQAETILMRLLRGSGLRGLGAIATVRRSTPRLVRPLLQVPRDDLREAALSAGLRWREDPSNDDPRFLRNRLRTLLLPLLEEQFQPGARTVLARTARDLASARDWLELETERVWRELEPVTDQTSIRLDRSRLASYHEVLIEGVIRRAFSSLAGSARGLGSAHILATLRATRDPHPRQIHLPLGVTAQVNRRELALVIRDTPPPAVGTGASKRFMRTKGPDRGKEGPRSEAATPDRARPARTKSETRT